MKNAVFPYHNLLAFSDADSLKKMSDEDRLVLFRRIAEQQYSESRWQAILELFFSWPDNSAKVQALSIADDLLMDWKTSWRNLNSSSQYIYHQGELSMVAKIARSFTISRREASGGKELISVAKSSNSENLVRLEIDRSSISLESLNAFAHSPHLRTLSELRFNGLTFTDDLFEFFLYRINLTSLRVLILNNCGVTDERIKMICNSPIVSGLNSLSLSGNSIGDKGVAVLAQTETLRQLEDLDLGRNFVSDTGVRQLITQNKLDNLKKLIIRNNYITNRKELEDLLLNGIGFVIEW